MADRDAKKVERQLDRISAGLPSGVGGFLRWLRSPSSRWVRIPSGLLLIIGGVVGFLPVLGFWMVPLGALLLAQDIPFLRRPVLQSLAWLERECIKWKSQRSRLPRDRHPKQWPRGIWKHALAQWAGKAYGLKNRCLVGKNARFRILQKLTSKPFRAMSALGH